MICKFEVRGGKSGSVFFTSKFLQTECFKKAEIAQKSIVPEYCTRSAGSDSSKSVLGKVVSSVVRNFGHLTKCHEMTRIIIEQVSLKYYTLQIPLASDNCPFICNSDICRNPIALSDTGYMYIHAYT